MGLLGSDQGYVFIRLSGPRLGRFEVLLLLVVGVCVCVLAMYVCPGFLALVVCWRMGMGMPMIWMPVMSQRLGPHLPWPT